MPALNQRTVSQAWYIVIVLTAVQTLSIADRYLVGVFAEAIKLEMALSDAQLGFLMGPAFLGFYCLFAIPMGLFADSVSRRNLIAVAVFVWSLATAAIAIADSFSTLLIARAFVGLGEACLLPAAMSLIAACFSPSRVARATSIFSLGGSIGKVLAFMGGAALLGYLASLAPNSLALFGLSAWRAVCIYAALLGLVLCLLMFSFQEPARSLVVQPKIKLLKAACTQLADHAFNYISLFVAMSAFIAISMSLASWAVSYFLRVHHLSIAEAGSIVGMAALVSTGGTLGSGWLVDRLTAKGILNAPLWVITFALLLMALFGLVLSLSAGYLTVAIIGFVAIQFCVSAGPPAYLTALHCVTPESCRATVFSIALVFVTLMGGSVGPILIGFMTDSIYTGMNGLALAMSTAFVVFGLSGAAAAYLGRNVFVLASKEILAT